MRRAAEQTERPFSHFMTAIRAEDLPSLFLQRRAKNGSFVGGGEFSGIAADPPPLLHSSPPIGAGRNFKKVKACQSAKKEKEKKSRLTSFAGERGGEGGTSKKEGGVSSYVA